MVSALNELQADKITGTTLKSLNADKITICDNGMSSLKIEKSPIIRINDENNNEVIRFERDGDIFVKGKFTENDKEVVQGFRDFLNKQ